MAIIALSVYQYLFIQPMAWKFAGYLILIVLIARQLSAQVTHCLFQAIKSKKSKKNRITNKSVTFMALATLNRGAICFGLITSLHDSEIANSKVVISATVFMIYTTTLFVGIFTPLFKRLLLEPVEDPHGHGPHGAHSKKKSTKKSEIKVNANIQDD